MEPWSLQIKNDNELMAMAARGDRAAFEALVLRYRPESVRYAAGLLRDEVQAQDIVQDSFADIYIQRHHYKPSYSFRTYLYTIIRHKAIDYLRKSGRRKEQSLEETGESVNWAYTDNSPEEQFFQRENAKELAGWIGQLPQDQKRALYLFAVEGRSYREIASILGKSLPQVRVAIHRARKKLTDMRDNR